MIPAMMNMTMMMMIIKTTIIGDYLKTSWIFHFSITGSFNLRLDDNATYSCEQYNLFVFCERVKIIKCRFELEKFWQQTSVSTCLWLKNKQKNYTHKHLINIKQTSGDSRS